MANKNLTDLTARTATADSDLIHVNSGGTDYKETKANFLSNITSSISSINSSLANSLVKNPSNIASYNEFDALATSGGFYAFRLSASFTIGGVALPNYGRGLIMNYSSSDSSFIYVSPDGFWYGFKNSGTWHVKRASTF